MAFDNPGKEVVFKKRNSEDTEKAIPTMLIHDVNIVDRLSQHFVAFHFFQEPVPA